jgi:SAM-dependent methyltransferase
MYEPIGPGYARNRRTDPRIAAQVFSAIGAAKSIVNVGAGTGNYEPVDRLVVAVDPATSMLAHRPTTAGPAVEAVAEALPFPDDCFDVALALFTVHHWQDRATGLAELARVSARQIILLNDAGIGSRFWLVDYFPEILTLPTERAAPTVDEVRRHLQVQSVQTVPVPADCRDGITGAYWRRPEAYLDPDVRAGMSPLAQLDADTQARGVRRLRADLATGAWQHRYGGLLSEDTYDCGYRLIIAGD